MQRRKALFPRTPSGHGHLALPPASCSGDGITLGESAGGVLATDLASPAARVPVSRAPCADGSNGHFPHIIDRAKPGLIGVPADGRRFDNEADGYCDCTDDCTAAMAWALPSPCRCCWCPVCAAATCSAAPALDALAQAQVLGRDGAAMAGLYAVGADMASMMGGFHPSGGINLGPAMTFGYLAGLHAAGITPQPP